MISNFRNIVFSQFWREGDSKFLSFLELKFDSDLIGKTRQEPLLCLFSQSVSTSHWLEVTKAGKFWAEIRKQ